MTERKISSKNVEEDKDLGVVYCTNCEEWFRCVREYPPKPTKGKKLNVALLILLLLFYIIPGIIYLIVWKCRGGGKVSKKELERWEKECEEIDKLAPICPRCGLPVHENIDYADKKQSRQKMHLQHNQEMIYGESAAKSKGYADGVKNSSYDRISGFEGSGHVLTHDEILAEAERIKAERKKSSKK